MAGKIDDDNDIKSNTQQHTSTTTNEISFLIIKINGKFVTVAPYVYDVV